MAVCGHCQLACLLLQDDIRWLKEEQEWTNLGTNRRLTTCGPSLELNPSPKPAPLLATQSPFRPLSSDALQLSHKFQALDSGDGPRCPLRPQLGDLPSAAQAATPKLAGDSSAAAADHTLNLPPPSSNAAESWLRSHSWTTGHQDRPAALANGLDRLSTPPLGGLCSTGSAVAIAAQDSTATALPDSLSSALTLAGTSSAAIRIWPSRRSGMHTQGWHPPSVLFASTSMVRHVAVAVAKLSAIQVPV